MADSTTGDNDNRFLKSWNSCETLGPNDSFTACHICKKTVCRREDEDELVRIISVTEPGSLFNFKSVFFLLCDCGNIAHVHCVYNSATVDQGILLDHIIKNETYKCCN